VRVDLGERLARLDRVAALLEADDADRVIDLVVLRVPARAQMERREPDRQRGEPLHVAGSDSGNLTDHRRPRQRVLVGIAALRAHPALVRGDGRAVRDGLLRESPPLGAVDVEVGEREQVCAGVEHELAEIGRPLAAQRCDGLAHLERVADRQSERLVHVREHADDVPLGALLSGGIDSAIVVALMAQASPEPVRTFTVGFADERYDERPFARAVAERWSTRHEEVVLEPDAAATLPRLAAAFDEPLGDEAALPLFLICEAARQEVTVALVGDGGDESFAGYERYAAMGLADRVPGPAAAAGARLLRALPAGRRERRSPVFRAARFLDAAAVPRAERYGQLMQVFTLGQRAELWTDEAKAEIGVLMSPGFLLGQPPAPGIAGLQLLDIATYLPGDLLPKSDIASMAHSLELRSPLLDHRVVELGLALPESLKQHGREAKLALRRAFADELPPLVAQRGKSGFGVPLARWFRGELAPLAYELLLDERARSRAWFRPGAVARLLDEHAVERADHGHRLWTLVMLELWQRTHVDADAPAPAAVTAT